ncbi:hypothetical protein B0H34DRAFT_716256 [Crassisporium funariophilum]|nr:hypothetical protein B0H34DRAFT_716256 [Crassisporium funariophilum]
MNLLKAPSPHNRALYLFTPFETYPFLLLSFLSNDTCTTPRSHLITSRSNMSYKQSKPHLHTIPLPPVDEDYNDYRLMESIMDDKICDFPSLLIFDATHDENHASAQTNSVGAKAQSYREVEAPSDLLHRAAKAPSPRDIQRQPYLVARMAG